MKSYGSATNFEIVQDFPEASGSTGSAIFTQHVANDNSGVALSLAYVLQGEQFQRQPALEVRVAAASAVAALAQDSSRGAQNQLNSSDPVYTSHMLHLLIHPSFTSTPHPDRLLVYPFENVHIHESLTFLKHALH
jgi:hypothetical protein